MNRHIPLVLLLHQGIFGAWRYVLPVRKMGRSGISAWAPVGAVPLWVPVKASWPVGPVPLPLRSWPWFGVHRFRCQMGGWFGGVATLEAAICRLWPSLGLCLPCLLLAWVYRLVLRGPKVCSMSMGHDIQRCVCVIPCRRTEPATLRASVSHMVGSVVLVAGASTVQCTAVLGASQCDREWLVWSADCLKLSQRQRNGHPCLWCARLNPGRGALSIPLWDSPGVLVARQGHRSGVRGS